MFYTYTPEFLLGKSSAVYISVVNPFCEGISIVYASLQILNR